MTVNLEVEGASAAAIANTMWFLDMLPVGIPAPEFSADEDGDVHIDWAWSRTRSITVICTKRPAVVYAWIDGDQNGRGVYRMDEGGPVPPVILAMLTRAAGGEGGRVNLTESDLWLIVDSLVTAAEESYKEGEEAAYRALTDRLVAWFEQPGERVITLVREESE